jgi:hypothetical protein
MGATFGSPSTVMVALGTGRSRARRGSARGALPRVAKEMTIEILGSLRSISAGATVSWCSRARHRGLVG